MTDSLQPDKARQLRLRFLSLFGASGLVAAASFGCSSGSASNSTAPTAPNRTAAPQQTSPPGNSQQPTNTSHPDGPPLDGAAVCGSSAFETRCYTEEQLRAEVGRDHGLRDPQAPPPPARPGYPGGELASNGCPVSGRLQDGCCNPASGTPTRQGGQCCYVFCTGSCCGRPFTIEGEAVLAKPVPRSDWRRRTPGESDERLGDAWLNDALMEHASIASFARFTLQLLALGAPAALVEASQQAALDEVRHAELCFGLASSYLGREVGPGALPVGGIGDVDWRDVVRSTFREGCVGETTAALVAQEQRSECWDAEVGEVLDVIASDEADHAALAWRFISWALATQPSVRQVLHQERVALASGRRGDASDAAPSPAGWRAAGRLSSAEQQAVERRAIHEVVLPCLDALLSRGPQLRPGCGLAVPDAVCGEA